MVSMLTLFNVLFIYISDDKEVRAALRVHIFRAVQRTHTDHYSYRLCCR